MADRSSQNKFSEGETGGKITLHSRRTARSTSIYGKKPLSIYA
ncbi:hypothetical protein C4K25_5933 [Pseudomonas chlororaphis]|nr:hypothetical protein C4K25_5933 [Pseudomonas chlororaphis]